MKNCKNCNNPLTGRQQKYCSQVCRNKHSNTIHNSAKSQFDRGLAKRIEVINYSGGECKHCGYKKNYAGLSFHHLDETTKSFQISMRECASSTIKLLKEEADKCILLCQNCHQEEHYPHLTVK